MMTKHEKIERYSRVAKGNHASQSREASKERVTADLMLLEKIQGFHRRIPPCLCYASESGREGPELSENNPAST